MKLMDIDSDTLGIPDTEYDARVTMPSSEFTRIVRDLSQLGESVRIEVSKEGVRFASEGEAANGSVLLRQAEGAASTTGGKITAKKDGDGDGEDAGGEDEDEAEGSTSQKKKKEKVKKEKKDDEDVEMEDEDGEKDDDEFKSKSDDEGEEEVNDEEEEEDGGSKKRKKKVKPCIPLQSFFFFHLSLSLSPPPRYRPMVLVVNQKNQERLNLKKANLPMTITTRVLTVWLSR